MNTNEMTLRKGQQGFTLVELAIVMIIIGLLITGILKGQEMIANAQVTSTISASKGLDAAASTFRDTYNAVAGDFNGAATRLSNTGCNGGVCTNGNGNSQIAEAPGVAAAAYGAENVQFFNHLRAADLISGFDGTNALGYGNALPTAPVGGGFTVGYSPAGAATGLVAGAVLRSGHYIVINGQANANVGAATGVLVPTQAARIDRKMDDGVPITGSVQLGGAAGCLNAGAYNEAVNNVVCASFIRIQQ